MKRCRVACLTIPLRISQVRSCANSILPLLFLYLSVFSVLYSPFCPFLWMLTSAHDGGGSVVLSSALWRLKDTCADPQLPVSNSIFQLGAYRGAQSFAAVWMNGDGAYTSRIRLHSSQAVMILQRVPGRKDGAWSVVVFCMVSICRPYNNKRRFTMKRGLGNSLWRGVSSPCPRFRQRLSISNSMAFSVIFSTV